jgi:uncharacterized membrane protein
VSRNKKYLCSVVCFAAATFVYIFLRLWNATQSCLFFDEIFSVHAALLPWQEMFRFLAEDLIHPPLFYVLLKFWIALGGETLVWLRLFSIFWMTLAILPLVLLCRELRFKFAETLTALALLAVNGSLIKYSQEVRMYSVLFCLALFSLLFFIRYLNRTEKLVFGALLLTNLLLVYTHYFGWLVVASQFVAIIFWRRELLFRFCTGLAALILSFAPWALMVLAAAQTNSGVGQNIGWMQKPVLKVVLSFVFSLHEPFYYQQLSTEAPNFLLVSLPFSFVCICAIFWLLFRQNDSPLRLLFAFAALPLALAFLASWILPYSIWGTRHLIIVFAPYALLAAAALNRPRPNVLKIAASSLLAALVLLGGAFHFSRRAPILIWCGWENLAREVLRNDPVLTNDSNEKLTIYAFEDLVAYHLWFATRNSSERVQIVNVEDFPGVAEDKAYFLPRAFGGVKSIDPNAIAGERFWIAYRDGSWNPTHAVVQDLTARGYRHGAPLEFKANGGTAFLVFFEK